MDFFMVSDEEKIKIQLESTYKDKLSKSVKDGKLNLLEYSYMADYRETNGTIVNTNWFIDLVNKIDDIDFSIAVTKIFKSFFKLCDKNDMENSKIKFKLSKLSDDIIEDKEDEITFTGDQKHAINEIFTFLPDYNKKAYGLYGYAGTGKTTIVVEMLSFLLKNKFIKSVVFSAPTNQAVDVIKTVFRKYLRELYDIKFQKGLGDHFDFDEILDKLAEVGIRIDFITIHKLLKFELDFSGEDGELTFAKGNSASLISQYDVIIIDECSMIPIFIAQTIFSEIKKSNQKGSDNFKKCPKIIFCGDPAQLPPVGEDSSIVFLQNEEEFKYEDYMKTINENEKCNDGDAFVDMKVSMTKHKYDILVGQIIGMNNYTLKKVMRSKLSSVTNVCQQIRLWTMGEIKVPKIRKYIGTDEKKTGVTACKYTSGDKIKTSWFQKCLEYYKNGNDCNIILTWTNKQANEYNQELRKSIFGNKKLNTYEVGDILMLNGFYNLDDVDKSNKDDYLAEMDKRFNTSEQIKITKIDVASRTVEKFTPLLSKKALSLQNSKYYESKYKQFVEIINNGTSRIFLCWKLQVKKVAKKNKNENTHTSVMYVIHEKSKELWLQEREFAYNNIRKLRTELVSRYRQKADVIDKHIIKPLWRMLHTNFVSPFANVTYGYSSTCHKGQGSNFYNVFVDAHDILKNKKSHEARKCLYTAITRASNELHLLMAP